MKTTNTHLTLFGATGGIGRALLDQALARGHRVTALARDPSKLPEHPRLSVVEGDVHDPAVVRLALKNADAALIALGAPALSKSRVRSEGTQTIVDAMRATNVRRLVCVSVLGAGDSKKDLPALYRWIIFPTYLRRPLQEHEAQEAIVRTSGLDWTLVRPPNLTDGPSTGDFWHGLGTPDADLTLKISRADVAGFMLQQLESAAYLRSAPALSYA